MLKNFTGSKNHRNLKRSRERVVGEVDNEYPAVCASIRKHYAAVAYHIFCTYMHWVSEKNQQISLRTNFTHRRAKTTIILLFKSVNFFFFKLLI